MVESNQFKGISKKQAFIATDDSWKMQVVTPLQRPFRREYRRWGFGQEGSPRNGKRQGFVVVGTKICIWHLAGPKGWPENPGPTFGFNIPFSFLIFHIFLQVDAAAGKSSQAAAIWAFAERQGAESEAQVGWGSACG